MSVRVVARIRPLLSSELEKDSIVRAVSSEQDARPTAVSIPNPKNPAESFNFSFNAVYDQSATQQDVFESEIAPTVKHLFNGFDTTIFAYGVTGTGKTHTMRGGKSLADRGVIPRLLSSIYRRCRKVEKDSAGETRVEVVMSYYEIYKDRVFDLFEPVDKRTTAGLPIRDHNGKTIVCGLTERPCETLKDFEMLYDHANVNRSTGATKLNAHSSRSHAVLCVKVSQTSPHQTIVSTASAIDLAGSEDNRRTENAKERMVESSCINKSLFVLAQCVEAITKKQSRIPYRESKMTRILSLGQNNGLMIMILNVAPVASYHLDTLGSLNFANRTKKIEVREVENEPIFRGPPKPTSRAVDSSMMQRQPLRSISDRANLKLGTDRSNASSTTDKPLKAFMVYSEKERASRLSDTTRLHGQKRTSSSAMPATCRPAKIARTTVASQAPEFSRAEIEDMVNRMVEEKLASRASAPAAKHDMLDVSQEVRRRLEALEQRVERNEDARAEGLQYLLMAKQHAARGEDGSALRMYQLATPYFPENQRLASKMAALEEKLASRRMGKRDSGRGTAAIGKEKEGNQLSRHSDPADTAAHDLEESADDGDDSYHSEHAAADLDTDEQDDDDDDTTTTTQPAPRNKSSHHPTPTYPPVPDLLGPPTPRTRRLLDIINSRDVTRITGLRGIGAKKAEAIVAGLGGAGAGVASLAELAGVRGVGGRMVENMRAGVEV